VTLFMISYLSRGWLRWLRPAATATATLSNVSARATTVIGSSTTTRFAEPYHPARNSFTAQHAT
jgi:hypothetical protein